MATRTELRQEVLRERPRAEQPARCAMLSLPFHASTYCLRSVSTILLTVIFKRCLLGKILNCCRIYNLRCTGLTQGRELLSPDLKRYGWFHAIVNHQDIYA